MFAFADSGTGEDYYYAGNTVLHQRVQQQQQQQGAVQPPIQPIRAAPPGAGMLASKFGTSLPVTIPGRFWPPKDAKDSFVAEGDESSDDEYEPRQRTVTILSLSLMRAWDSTILVHCVCMCVYAPTFDAFRARIFN